jgi:hypothetical protein
MINFITSVIRTEKELTQIFPCVQYSWSESKEQCEAVLEVLVCLQTLTSCLPLKKANKIQFSFSLSTDGERK